MIQAIVFDAVGTLMHVTPSVAAVYGEVGRRFGSQLGDAEIRARFSAAFAEQDRLDESVRWRTSEARERMRWRVVVSRVFNDVVDVAGCFDVLHAAFAKPEAWTFDPEWDPVSAELERRGIRQAVASNFDRRLHGILAGLPATQRLASIVVSSEVGHRKPAQEFFAQLIAKLQVPAADILFLGDDRTNDYDSARQAGMRAILLDPQGKHLDVGPDRVERLADVLNRV